MKGRTLIAWNLRRLRTQRGITQLQLGLDAGVHNVYVGNMEREEENPTVEILDRLAKALGVPLREFFIEPQPGAKRAKGLKSGRKPKSK